MVQSASARFQLLPECLCAVKLAAVVAEKFLNFVAKIVGVCDHLFQCNWHLRLSGRNQPVELRIVILEDHDVLVFLQ